MNVAVFGLTAFVFGACYKRSEDTGSIWIKFKGSESAKEYDKNHPIFEESILFCNMFFALENVEINENDSIPIPYGDYAFDIVAGLLKRESKKKSREILLSFEQLLHVFELMNYLCFNEDAEKSINSKLFQKTLDGRNAESVFAATRNDQISTSNDNELHTSLGYFLCLKAYAEMHGLCACIDIQSYAVAICASYNKAYGSKFKV